MEVSTLDQTEHFENELIERTLLVKSKLISQTYECFLVNDSNTWISEYNPTFYIIIGTYNPVPEMYKL